MELTNDLLEKAKRAESAPALLALAKENGVEMTAEEAEAYFAQLHKSGELSDEELENVSGGGCRKNGHLVVSTFYKCDLWRCKTHNISAQPSGWNNVHTNHPYDKCPKCGAGVSCESCYFCKREKGLWLCYNPEK